MEDQASVGSAVKTRETTGAEAGTTAPKDLRSFLQQLKAHDPRQLLVVEREVDPEFEAAAIVHRLKSDNNFPKFPAVLFKSIRGSKLPLILNLHGTYERVALSIESTVHTMAEEYSRRERQGGTLRRVGRSEAPVKEVVLTGDDVDLSVFPFLKRQELDSGLYITSAASLTRDPQTGAINAGIFRHQVHGKRELGFHPNPTSSTGYILWQQQQKNEPLEVALAIGHHPAMLMCAAGKSKGVGGELEIASGLLQQPLEVVPGETIDMDVPARAEIVIEGVVDTNPDTFRMEGPFGEYPRYYTGVGPEPVIKVTAITMRRNPIYVDVFNAHDEHLTIGGLPLMGRLLSRVREVLPSVKALNLPVNASARLHAYISLKKRVDGEPHMAAFAALSHEMMLKHIFLVDDDIDVFDEGQVMWAFATRFQADKDLTIIPNSLGGRLNPVTYGYHRDEKGHMETKLIFDCTRPVGVGKFPEACRVPPEVVARIDPMDWLRSLQENDLPS